MTVGETVGEIVTVGISIGGLLYLRGWSWVTDANGEPIPLFDPALWDFWFPALIGVLALQALFHIAKLVVGRWTIGLAIVNAVLLAALAVPFAYLAVTGSLINPAFAAEVGWPPLAEGDGVVMLAVAGATVLISGWEAVDGFRKARRPQPTPEYARMTTETTKPPSVPPRWFVRTAWVVHRAIYRLTFGRIGLWPPKPNRWGTMRLTTVGRRSGRERVAILGYYEDGANLVTMAMNGWSDGEPAWWLNLQAQPDATVVVADGSRDVRGRCRAWRRACASLGPMA